MLLVLILPNTSRAFFASSSDTDTVILLVLLVLLIPTLLLVSLLDEGSGKGLMTLEVVSDTCFLCMEVEIRALSSSSLIVVDGGAGGGSPFPFHWLSSLSILVGICWIYLKRLQYMHVSLAAVESDKQLIGRTMTLYFLTG